MAYNRAGRGTRRGIFLLDLAAAMVVLSVAMAVILPAVAATRRAESAATARLLALEEVRNVAERAVAGDFGRPVDASAIEDLALRPELQARIGHGELRAEIEQLQASERLTITLTAPTGVESLTVWLPTAPAEPNAEADTQAGDPP